ncbi:hypothetical protein ROZALSC1DRAFT_29410 [Rozella allomycis CSF55]|uniref:Uncharacterized protein n=1 Tax=Rozella allomycis (strain CSF55) TaxID=988480 RepID=A0A075AR28_ROZAC|nr:hypothetical protein O9G_000821 [Rozella allomycis CSF55]RKP18932.1 hypothetical protein ROZALSC1DRAFT_29410 [Rozella allomycis CSF55]|eukprot:EPZ32746.1 hypothetical protein O9G_000821 [Rozella allomycis CSF55]
MSDSGGTEVWRIWARYQGLTTSLIAGGIIGCFYPRMYLGIVSIVIGVIVALFDYPLPLLYRLGSVFSQLYIRGIFYILLAVPVCGSMFLVSTGITYIYASYAGETWKSETSKVKVSIK